MSGELGGMLVAFLATSADVGEAELTEPWQAVEEAGGRPVLIAPNANGVEVVNGKSQVADTLNPDLVVADVCAEDFDALVLPGRASTPGQVRLEPETVSFLRFFAQAGKPIAATCHAPAALIEAGVVAGKTLTSCPSVRAEVHRAGGTWRDEEVVVCAMRGFPLVTSRASADLDAFGEATVKVFAAVSRPTARLHA